MGSYYVPDGNWTQAVVNSIGELQVGQHIYPIDMYALSDPAPGCQKDFLATYSCGLPNNIAPPLTVAREANGKNAIFDCKTQYDKCNNLRLSLADDGTIYLKTLDNKEIWNSQSVSGFTSINPAAAMDEDSVFTTPANDNNRPLKIKAYAGDGSPDMPGIVGRASEHNYLEPGQMLNRGEWIGSPSGTCRLMMMEDNSLQVVKSILGCNDLDIPRSIPTTPTSPDQNTGTDMDIKGARMYTIDSIYNNHIGKVGYVNNFGQLQLYPESMTSYGTQFEKIGSYNIDGAKLGEMVHTETSTECEKKCTMGSDSEGGNTQECAGIIFDISKTNSEPNCQLLNKAMYNQHRIIDNKYEYYIRQKGVSGQDNSCPYDVSIQTAGFWQGEDLSSNNMTPNTLCGLANYVAAERTNVANKLPEVYNNLQYKDNNGNVKNYSFADASNNASTASKSGFKYWYESLQHKYTILKNQIFSTNTDIDNKFNELQSSRQDLADWTGEQLQNLTAMNEDRDLNMMSQNYRHIMWSILAIIIIIGTIKITKSFGSASASSGSASSGPASGGSGRSGSRGGYR
jgi:hypothetical protein